MKNILVPIDFSDASKIAARFAARVALQAKEAHIILYNMFSGHMAGSDGSPVAEGAELSRTIRTMALGNIASGLDLQGQEHVKLEWCVETGHSLTEYVNRMVVSENIDLVVMGASGATRLEQILVGSNTLRMVRHATCPVLVIPPHAEFGQYNRVALTAEPGTCFDNVPVKRIESMLEIFHGELHVVYIDEHPGKPLTTIQELEKAKLEAWLSSYQPAYHHLPHAGFVKAVNKLVHDTKIDLIITVPHKTSYLNDMFNYTSIEKLRNHSHTPFIAVPA